MDESRLRIAMLSAHSCPVGKLGARDTGGMSVYIRELARELGKQGHSVDIYTRIHDPADPQIINLGRQSRLIHLRAGQDNDVHKLALYCYLPEFMCNLENFRKDNGLEYDIVFSHYWLSTWVGNYLRQWWQVPQVTMFHTLGLIKNDIGTGEEEPELRIVTERDAINGSQRIIASTLEEKEAIVGYYGASPDNISVVPCGVNIEQFRPCDRMISRNEIGLTYEKILLFVGRIDPLKGVEQLVESLGYLKKFANLKLIIIGGDEESRKEIYNLKKKAQDAGIIGKIEFLGTIKHERLPLYYNAADICVVPSYYESFGMVALESLACGTPVVATDVGDLRNIIEQGKTGYVIPDNSPQRIADKITELLDRNDLDRRLISESVRNYSWDYIAEKIVGELIAMLSKRPVEASYVNRG